MRTTGAAVGMPMLSTFDAAGIAQGGPADASAGLTEMVAGGARWAWNPLQAQWQRKHTIVKGDTVWALTAYYYGSPSIERVNQVGAVPQNKPILGPMKDQAVPGDVILIPGLAQPGPSPAPAAAPTPAPTAPPMSTVEPIAATAPFTGFVLPGSTTIEGLPVMIPGTPPGTTTPKPAPTEGPGLVKAQPEGMSTGAKVALVGGIAAVGGLAAWGLWAASKRKKRRRR